MAGSKPVPEKMKSHTEEYLKSSRVFKDVALNGFQFSKKIANENKCPDFTEDQDHRWKLKYQNAASFFCNFVDGKPVIYRVCVQNQKPVDVSTLAENTGFDFLGSGMKQARKYLVETGCEEFEKDDNVSVDDIFVQFAKYLARAIVSSALVDKFSGGDIQLKCIYPGKKCLSLTSDVAQVYLESYGDLGMHKAWVVLLFVSIELKDGADAVLK